MSSKNDDLVTTDVPGTPPTAPPVQIGTTDPALAERLRHTFHQRGLDGEFTVTVIDPKESTLDTLGFDAAEFLPRGIEQSPAPPHDNQPYWRRYAHK